MQHQRQFRQAGWTTTTCDITGMIGWIREIIPKWPNLSVGQGMGREREDE